MAFSVISGFNFNPALCAEYAAHRFVENLKIFEREVGLVTSFPALRSNLANGGEYIDMPYAPLIASLVTKRDLTATTAPTDLDLTGATQRAIILRRKAGPVKFTEDLYVRGVSKESAEQEIGRQIGLKCAQDVKEAIIGMIIAALAGITSTPHTVATVYSTSAKVNYTYALLHALRMKMGDNYNMLSTVIMHSNVFADLVSDGLATYKIQNVGGYSIVTGLPQAFGLNFLVTDDPALRVANGGNYKKYNTLIVGKGALGLVYPQALRIEAERRLDFEAPYWRILANYDFAAHLWGTTWNSTANPTVAAYQTSSAWDEKYDDVREVLAVHQEHNSSAD